MEKPVQIQTIDIGNDGSAFVEVQVGRKGSLTQVRCHLVTFNVSKPLAINYELGTNK
jgi:hypothetical protein